MTNYCHATKGVIEHPAANERSGMLRRFDRRVLMMGNQGRHDYVLLLHDNHVPEEAFLFERLEIGVRPENIFVGLSPEEVLFKFGERTERDHIAVDVFSGTSDWLRDLLQSAGYTTRAPSLEDCWRANDKSDFQGLFGNRESEGIHIPRGKTCFTRVSVQEAVSGWHEKGKAARIKHPRSASGLGQLVVRPGESIDWSRLPGKQTANWVVQEELFASRRVIDLSVQFKLGPGPDQAWVQQVTGQHISERGFHKGNFYPAYLNAPEVGLNPIPCSFIRNAEEMAGKMLAILKDRIDDLFGTGSIDFLASPETGEVYAVEINFRKTAPHYPRTASQRWFNEVRPFDMRSLWLPAGLTLDDLVSQLKRDGVLFDRKKERGMLPFCFLLDEQYPNHNYCNSVVYGRSTGDLLELVPRVHASLACLNIAA